MSRRIFASVFFALWVAISGWTQTTETIRFNIAGADRNFVVHVPNGVSNPALVFFVHGYGGNGASFANDTKGDVVADREKFIAVYPSAISGSWNMHDTTDYPFLLAIVDTVDARYGIDRNKVYCSGFSQGGFISFGVGYKHPEVFAAVAPVSGHIPSFSTAQPLPRPVPMFMTFGTNDISSVSSFMDDLNTWLRLNNCSSNKTVVRPYPASNPNSVVARILYQCAQGSEIVVDSVIGGGHEWAMNTHTKVNTTEEVWAFFKRFSLNSSTDTTPSVKVYRNLDFDGLAATLHEGSYTQAELLALGVQDNDISSMKVDSGLVVELFDDDHFQSTLGLFQGEIANLISQGVNDKTTSLKVLQLSSISSSSQSDMSSSSQASSRLENTDMKMSAFWQVNQKTLTLHLDHKALGSIEIFDVQGHLQQHFAPTPLASGDHLFSIASLPHGIYIARFVSPFGVLSHQFTIMN